MTSTTDDRVVFTSDEILAGFAPAEPLIAGGVRCHGGFDPDGRYVSPRTCFRRPAIATWQAQHERSGAPLIRIDRALLPPQYPNVVQSKLLLLNGVREPVVRMLTIISIVEGFGAMIRNVKVPDLSDCVVEPVDGTALAHLQVGLFEAHARDESGYRDEGGHKQMWEAARDLAFENPKIPGDVLMTLMGRRRQGERAKPAFPEIGPKFEQMLTMLAQVFVVEVFAERTFQWGIDLLGDAEVSAEPAAASEMVTYIQRDETPHVEYLRTALSEVRARTLRTVDGGEIAGRTVVDGLMHRILEQMTHARRDEQREELRANLIRAMQDAINPEALLEEFESMGTEWVLPQQTGFEPAAERALA